MLEAISGSSSSSQKNFRPHHQNVRYGISSCSARLISVRRLVCDQNISPKCFKRRRNLCQHVEEGLEITIWRWSYSGDN